MEITFKHNTYLVDGIPAWGAAAWLQHTTDWCGLCRHKQIWCYTYFVENRLIKIAEELIRNKDVNYKKLLRIECNNMVDVLKRNQIHGKIQVEYCAKGFIVLLEKVLAIEGDFELSDYCAFLQLDLDRHYYGLRKLLNCPKIKQPCLYRELLIKTEQFLKDNREEIEEKRALVAMNPEKQKERLELFESFREDPYELLRNIPETIKFQEDGNAQLKQNKVEEQQKNEPKVEGNEEKQGVNEQ
ncbi:unnamed protein product [Caenorhabditis bovis]|uniref:Uncharacterized protein n=2 Tax=Caenorhabditis bovis TaxID=2654633 RepID=A0A8S1EHW2_9PELO|nr:unnamed protein product [Caenorhabditis bovis]